MILHMNHLLADGSHELSNLDLFIKKQLILKNSFSANFQRHFFL